MHVVATFAHVSIQVLAWTGVVFLARYLLADAYNEFRAWQTKRSINKAFDATDPRSLGQRRWWVVSGDGPGELRVTAKRPVNGSGIGFETEREARQFVVRSSE